MNHYAQALAELQAAPAHELRQIGDQWQTPKALAWGLFHHFAPTLGPVVLDMFADNCNALVPHYYDAADNALTQELAVDLRRLGGAAYANPPYSRPCVDDEGNPITGMEAILTYCREQRALGARILLLIKAATSETWWPEDADFIQFISGRIGFEVPSWYSPRDPRKDKPSSSGFASAVVIFDASWQGERRPLARLRRDDLITTGQIILEMIQRQALTLIEEAGHTLVEAHTHQLADTSNRVGESSSQTEPWRQLQIYRTPSGQWGARYLENGEKVAEVVAGCDSRAEAMAAAEDSGWLWESGIELYIQQDDQLSSGGLPLAAAATPSPHPDYADAHSIMAKQLECIDLNDEERTTVSCYVQGWLAESDPLSEIYYRLELAVTNLLAGHPVHQGFVMEGRTPALPHWQRHPAVKAIIYQIDDADILTPAKTAELAAWIIDHLDEPQLLEQATNKAAELLAHSAEPTSLGPDHCEQQLDMLDGAGQEPDARQQAEEPSTKPLEDWAFDYRNDQLNLGGAEWSCFVAVLTVLYGIKERYSAREVAIAISVSDEQLMDEYTTLDEETKVLLRKTVSALKQVEGFNFTETCPVLDPHRQEAVIALLNALHKEPDLSPTALRSVMINTITRMYEVAA